MKTRSTLVGIGIAVSSLMAPAVLAVQDGASDVTARQVFRADTTIVPIDVRVVDRQNRPVTDLTQADFTVTENGKLQEIVVFTTQTMAAARAATVGPLRRRDAMADSVVPEPYRVFLLVLGRGGVTNSVNGVKDSLVGLDHFLKDDLHPQDYVAVIGYNRATDFTTDHAAVRRLLSRFRDLNQRIEADFAMSETGLRAIYGNREVWPATQRAIDRIFTDPKLGVRQMIPLDPAAIKKIDDEQRGTVDWLQEYERSGSALDGIVAASRTAGSVLPQTPTAEGRSIKEMATVPSAEDYAAKSIRAMQDIGNLYAGVEALRNLDGERHLIFVTPVGVDFGRDWDAAKPLARIASDARVVIDVIQTDGLVTNRSLAHQTSLTEMTGGRYDINRHRWATEDLDLINQDTNFKYVLGYKPSNGSVDGTFREIRVRVNRPGLRVVNREGYFARDSSATVTLHDTTVFARVAAAAHLASEVPDIGLRATASLPKAGRDLTVDLEIDLSRLLFDKTPGGGNTASIDVAAFCLDAKQRGIGEAWKTVTFDFSDARRAQFERAGGAPVQVVIPITGTVDSVKLVAYQFAADLIGTRNLKVSTK